MVAKKKTNKKSDAKATKRDVLISAPRFQEARFTARGTAPYVSNNFGAEARAQMKAVQEAGDAEKKKRTKNRKPKDFQKGFRESLHESTEGWYGIPAAAFRKAMISACRVAGFVMTKAKLTVFVEADGFDKVDGAPLVKFSKGKPHYVEHYVRNDNGGADIRPRGMWDAGWEAVVRVRYDADQFSLVDVANLMMRVGMQVGIGAGRPDSTSSAGMGWGLFEVCK